MKKALTVAVSVMLVAAIAVAGTLAYLSASSDAVVNQFVFGNVGVSIAEPSWTGNNETAVKVAPGQIVPKNPTVTVTGTEKVYVYVLLKNTINTTTDSYLKYQHAVKVEGQEDTYADGVNPNWTEVTGFTGQGTVYRYKGTVSGVNAKGEPEPAVLDVLFDHVVISENVTMEHLKPENNPFKDGAITLSAYVHQAEADATADMITVADAAALAHFAK